MAESSARRNQSSARLSAGWRTRLSPHSRRGAAQEVEDRQRPAAPGAAPAAGLGAGLRWGLGAGLGQWIAIALVVTGLLMGNLWLLIMGAFVLIAAHMEGPNLLSQGDAESVLMRDVMLTQFSTLSASDTLEDALQRAVHSLQDVFP